MLNLRQSLITYFPQILSSILCTFLIYLISYAYFDFMVEDPSKYLID